MTPEERSKIEALYEPDPRKWRARFDDTPEAGSIPLEIKWISRKIGPNAWRLWRVLMNLRDRDGFTFISKPRLLERMGLVDVRQLKRLYRKLEAIKIVEPGSWYGLPRRKVYRRRVFGRWGIDDGTVLVTQKIWGVLMYSYRGRGRPKGRLEKNTPFPQSYPPSSVLVTPHNRVLLSTGSSSIEEERGAGAPRAVHSSGPDEEARGVTTRSVQQDLDRLRELHEARCRRERAAELAFTPAAPPGHARQGAQAAPMVPSCATGTPLSLADLAARAVSGSPGSARGGPGRGSPPPSTEKPLTGARGASGAGAAGIKTAAGSCLGSPGGRGPGGGLLVGPDLPTYPGHTVVPTVVVPAAPKLRPEMRDIVRVERLIAAYRAAVERATGKPCHVFKRGDLTKSKHYAALVDAAVLMVEHDLAPHGWAAFSLDQWQKDRGKRAKSGKPPAITWVFAPARISKLRGWYREVATSYCASRMYVVDAHRDLIVKFLTFQADLRDSIARGQGGVQEVLDRHFPRDTWSRLVDLACKRSREEQFRVTEAAHAGKWVW